MNTFIIYLPRTNQLCSCRIRIRRMVSLENNSVSCEREMRGINTTSEPIGPGQILAQQCPRSARTTIGCDLSSYPPQGASNGEIFRTHISGARPDIQVICCNACTVVQMRSVDAKIFNGGSGRRGTPIRGASIRGRSEGHDYFSPFFPFFSQCPRCSLRRT